MVGGWPAGHAVEAHQSTVLARLGRPNAGRLVSRSASRYRKALAVRVINQPGSASTYQAPSAAALWAVTGRRARY